MMPALVIRTCRCAALLFACLLVERPAAAQRSWLPPVTLTPANQQSGVPQLAMDGAGNAVATWIRAEVSGQPVSRVTQAVRLSATGLTGPLANLYTPAASTAVAFETADVALNGAGRGAAVWVRATGAAPADQMVQAALFDGVGWSSAVNLLPASAAGLLSPRVDVDSDGNAVAVWVQPLGGFTVVRAVRYQAGGGWGAPVTVSAGTESVVDGVVALSLDDVGNAVAVWTVASGGVPALRAAQFTELTNTWGAPATIGPAGRSPSVVRLVQNRAGTAAFVLFRAFEGGHDIVRASRLDPPSGVWTTPADVSVLGQDVFEMDVAVDEQGRALAVWTRFDGANRSVQTSRFAGSWSTPSTRTTGVETRDVSIDTDAVGNAIAAWTRLDGSQHRVQASAFTAATGAWTPAVDVSDSSADAAAPRVRLQSDGGAALVWQSRSDTFYIQSSRFVLSAAPVLQPAAVNGAEVTLSWTPGAGQSPSGYTVAASRSPGGAIVAWFPAGTQTSISVTAQEGAYYVRVLATSGGALVPSNEIEVIVGAGPAPTVPRNLSAVVNGSSFTMAWDPPVNAAIAPVRTYYIEAGSAPGVSNLAFFPTGNAQTTFVTPPVPNGSYWVRVRAQSPGGVGPSTPDLRVVIGPPPPGAPVLSGGATGSGAVLLQWTAAPAPGAPVTGYQLIAGYQPGQGNAAVFTLPASSLSFATTGVPPGPYYVRVVALSSAGPGAESNEVVVSVMP